METTVFTGGYLRLTTELRGENSYEHVYVRAGVSIIPITEERKICFVRERHWSQPNVRTSLAAGYLKDNENPLVGAMRELHEEAGLEAARWELFLTTTSEEAIIHKTAYYFIARDLKWGEPRPDKGEHFEGTIQLTPAEVREHALRGEFGTGRTAFVLLKLVEQLLSS